LDGVIVVDKPEGWTSHDVVGKVRSIVSGKPRSIVGGESRGVVGGEPRGIGGGKAPRAAKTKVGHLGTLDPIATGVLPLVIGHATRLAQFYTHSDKIYEGLVRFGWATNTYDRAGEPLDERREFQIDAEELERHLERFRGKFMQTPPPVSAKKVDGRRAYELARKDIAVELAPVAVEVYELTVLAIDGADVRLRVHCSGGTYVRSIAHDLGRSLGCGAHLSELRRLASGEFKIEQARTIAQLEALATDGRLVDAIVPAAQMMPGFPSVFVDDLTAAQIRTGRNFPASPFRSQPAQYVKAVTREGQLVAVGEAVLPNVYHPLVVL
jgi:tRNA pseudouridine55 synthase